MPLALRLLHLYLSLIPFIQRWNNNIAINKRLLSGLAYETRCLIPHIALREPLDFFTTLDFPSSCKELWSNFQWLLLQTLGWKKRLHWNGSGSTVCFKTVDSQEPLFVLSAHRYLSRPEVTGPIPWDWVWNLSTIFPTVYHKT